MVATLTKVKVAVVEVVTNKERRRLEAENKTVLRGAADAMEGKINNAGMELYTKILGDMIYP